MKGNEMKECKDAKCAKCNQSRKYTHPMTGIDFLVCYASTKPMIFDLAQLMPGCTFYKCNWYNRLIKKKEQNDF
jgi:hypothetical protein